MIQMILVLTMFLVIVGLFYIITKDIIKELRNKNVKTNFSTLIYTAYFHKFGKEQNN